MSGENTFEEETGSVLQEALSEIRQNRLSVMTRKDDSDLGAEDPSGAGDSNFKIERNEFKQKYRTSSPLLRNGAPKLDDDVTVLSTITMEESRSCASNSSHLSEDEFFVDLDQVAPRGSIGSSISGSFSSTVKSIEDWNWPSQRAAEITCTKLKRLLGKFGNPFSAPLPNNPGALFLLLENYLEESNKAIEELKQIVKQKDKEMREANNSALERQEALIQEHRKRVSAIVKDHEGHLSASIERAMNARRQTAGIQTQLMLSTSKLEVMEKKHRDECDTLRRRFASEIDALTEELNTMRKKIAVADNIKQENIYVTLPSTVRSVPKSNVEAKEAESYLKDLRMDIRSPQMNNYKTEKAEAISSHSKEPVLKSSPVERTEDLKNVRGQLAKVDEDIAAKNRDVEKSRARIVVLDSKLALLDSQIELLSTEVLKRDDSLRALQHKVEEKDVLLRSLSKKVKAEKRRSSRLSLSVTVTKEQEKLVLEKLRSLQREKDNLDGQCTIRRSQVATLADILQSREKMIVQLQRELVNTDTQLSKLFDLATVPYNQSPDWAIAARTAGLIFNSSGDSGTSGDDTCTDLRDSDMSLESSIITSPIYCSSNNKTTRISSSQDNVATLKRIEWLRTSRLPSSFDADSGISSSTVGSSLEAARHASAVPDLVQLPSRIGE